MTPARNPLMDPAAGDVVRTVAGTVLRVEAPSAVYPDALLVWWNGAGPIKVLVSVWRQVTRGGTVVARGCEE